MGKKGGASSSINDQLLTGKEVGASSCLAHQPSTINYHPAMTETQRIDDRQMIAATETAKRNPMRPPETLPRDASTAIRVFAAHPSPQLIALFVAAFAAWRLELGHF